MISILITPIIFVEGLENINRIMVYTHPPFSVQDNIMFVVDDSTLFVSNTTDLTDYSKTNDWLGVFIDFVGTELVYPYRYENHLYIPTFNTTGNDDVMIEILDCTDIYSPEYEGYCILSGTKSSSSLYEHKKLLIDDNFLFLQVKEDSYDSVIQFVNLTDIANPTCLTRYKHGTDEIFDYVLYENFMIIAIDDSESIRMVDITDKSSPFDISNNYSVPFTYSISLEVKNNLLFANSGTTISVFNITDIHNFDLLYKIELVSSDNTIRRIIFYNDYLITHQYRKISFFDLNTPSNTTISEIISTAPGFHYFAFGLVDNDRLYTSWANEYQQYTWAVYDLTDTANPVLIFPTSFTIPFPVTIATILSSILLVTSVTIFLQKKRK